MLEMQRKFIVLPPWLYDRAEKTGLIKNGKYGGVKVYRQKDPKDGLRP